MSKLSLADLDVKGQRVLIRVDFNVPMRDGAITDDSRIRASLPTLRVVSEAGGRVILMSHLGRPKGKVAPEFSLEPVARHLAEVWGREIRFVDDCVGPAAAEAADKLQDGEVLLLENLRFHPEEEANDPGFAKQLAALGDLYVNDAFGAAHRAHASTVGVTAYLRTAAAGRLMAAELHYLDLALSNPRRPVVAILGGAKISGKIDVLTNLLDKVDRILIGGGMTYTFYRAQGIEIGDSLIENDRVEMAGEVLRRADKAGVQIVLPVDSVISSAPNGSEPISVSEGEAIHAGSMGLDIGPKSRALFAKALTDAATVVWNGPLGVFEVDAFSEGTLHIARAVADVTTRGGTTVIGGGDSVAAISRAGLPRDAFSHISTGGGAFLEYLEGIELPGVAALTDKG